MNKKGQWVFAGIGIAITVFIVAVVLIEPLKEVILLARDVDHLDCTNTTIPTGQSATCLIVDIYLPYFFMTAVGAGLAYIGGRKAYQTYQG